MREPKRPSNRPTVRPPLERRKRVPTQSEYAALKEQLAQYINEYGRDLLKAEVNRKAVPKPPGRPPLWDYLRLFTLWLAVHAFAQKENLKIDIVCKKLAASGGILEGDLEGELEGDRDEEPRKIATTSGNIRRLFYTAEKELEKWVPPLHHEPEYLTSINGASLKKRLLAYAELLSSYEEFFLTGLWIAQRIVHYELSRDGVCECFSSLAPPLHPPEMALVRF